MPRWPSVTVLSLLLVFLWGAPALPEDLRMVTGEWKPYTSQTMENLGTFTEIVTRVTRAMGLRPCYRFLPWKRCEFAVLNGKAWAAFPYGHNEERARRFAFSDEVAVSVMRFFYNKDNMDEISWNTLSDLKPYRIGGVIGYFYEEDFQRAGLNVEYTSRELLNLKKLISGRIDLFPVNERVGWNLIERHFPEKRDRFGVLDRPQSVQGLRLMVNRTDPESMALLDRFSEALEQMGSGLEF